MVDFGILISYLETPDVREIALPFLLVFILIFAIMVKAGIFKMPQQLVISAALGLGVVIPHALDRYPPCWDVVVIINNALPNIGLAVLAIVAFLIILVFVGGFGFLSKAMGFVLMGLIAFITYIFLTSGGCTDYREQLGYLIYLIPLAIFLILIFIVTRNGNDSAGGPAPPTSMYP